MKKDQTTESLMRGIRGLIERADTMPPLKRYVVTLKHREHGNMKINRVAADAAAASASALKLVPGCEVVNTVEE